MLREQQIKALELLLSFWGLDVARYTSALPDSFLRRWPDPDSWAGEEAHAALISTFAIGETTFLRHPEHFAALRTMLPDLAVSRTGPLRAWSAGCASGEEAYSLAATLALLGNAGFELGAWDLNADAVERARLGEYRPWSLRGVQDHATDGWLEPAPCGVRVADWLRQLVRFEVKNLCLDDFPTDLDVIFCRNVLLYFRPDAAQRVLARFAQSLRPGGVLFLGYYDPRPEVRSGLLPETLGPIPYYRRPRHDLAATRVRSVRPAAPASIAPVARISEPTAPQDLSLAGQMARARELSSQRRGDAALKILGELSRDHPLHPTVHVLTALVAEDAGDMGLMLQAARRACFLLPDHAAPNYFLSVAFARNGELRRATVHRRIAAHSVRRETRTSSVLDHSEGLTVGQLRRLIGGLAK